MEEEQAPPKRTPQSVEWHKKRICDLVNDILVEIAETVADWVLDKTDPHPAVLAMEAFWFAQFATVELQLGISEEVQKFLEATGAVFLGSRKKE